MSRKSQRRNRIDMVLQAPLSGAPALGERQRGVKPTASVVSHNWLVFRCAPNDPWARRSEGACPPGPVTEEQQSPRGTWGRNPLGRSAFGLPRCCSLLTDPGRVCSSLAPSSLSDLGGARKLKIF